jgi:hypothetical protein
MKKDEKFLENEKKETADELARKIKESKGKVTEEQSKEAVNEIKDGELLDNDLDEVAGGRSIITSGPVESDDHYYA